MAMRPLNKGERQKLVLFFGLIFILVNFFGLNFLAQHRQELELQRQKLQAQKSYDEAWVNQRALWEKRQEWLTQNQPKLDEAGQGNVRLLETLQKLAREDNLTITEQSLLEPRKTAAYQEVSVKLQLVGSLESLTRWLVRVQQPTGFHAITNFSVKTDSDATKVRCDLSVAKWYQPVN